MRKLTSRVPTTASHECTNADVRTQGQSCHHTTQAPDRANSITKACRPKARVAHCSQRRDTSLLIGRQLLSKTKHHHLALLDVQLCRPL
eukprot:9281628-Lingulodinium_polyedra.AAC.1